MSKKTRKPSSAAKQAVQWVATGGAGPRRAEEDPTTIQARLAHLLNASPAIAYSVTPDNVATWVSRNVESISGYTVAECLVPGWWEEGLHPDDRQRMFDDWPRLFENNTHAQEYRFQFKDGSYHWIHNRMRLIRDPQGNPFEILGSWHDITERKKAEQELREERNRFEAIVSAMVDGLTIHDTDYNVIYQNDTLKRLFGDRLGEKCYRVYEGKDRVCDGCPVKMAFKDGKPHVSVTTVEMPSGEIAIWESTACPLRNADGTIVSCLEIAKDITERKRLEQSVATITAEERERLRRDLHDGVCQQLTGLRLLVASLHQALLPTDPKLTKRVAYIEQIAGDTLISVRQVASGLEPLSGGPDALVTALQELAARVNGLYDFQCRFTSRKPVLVRNPDTATHLFLIAQEAVSNAVRHAKPGRITISLSERSGTVRLVVKDDGAGFSHKRQSKGMGLNIMRTRAALIGASLDIQAGKAGGSVVTCSWKKAASTSG